MTRYGYDLRGRQTETHLDGDDIAEATTARDSRGGVVAETTGGVTTTHLLDYLNLTGYSQVLEQRTGSELTRSFVLGPSVLAQADGQGGGGTAYLLRDAHSGVRFTTDAAGLMAEQYAYDAFGVPLGFDPATARSAHLFHGERFSPALGGSDVRGERVYESGTGRWRTADRYTPGVGDLSDRNRYAFVGADPVNFADPTGMAVSYVGLLAGTGKMLAIRGLDVGARALPVMVRVAAHASVWQARAVLALPNVLAYSTAGLMVVQAAAGIADNITSSWMRAAPPPNGLDNAARGRHFERLTNVNLGASFPGYDDFDRENGVVTQVKTHARASAQSLLDAIDDGATNLQRAMREPKQEGYDRFGQFQVIESYRVRCGQLVVGVPASQAGIVTDRPFVAELNRIAQRTGVIIRVIPIRRW